MDEYEMRYIVWCPGIGENIDDSYKILAVTHEDAALIWAEFLGRKEFEALFGKNNALVLVSKIDADDKPGLAKTVTVSYEEDQKETLRVLSSEVTQ